jgi:hypothetical protein
MCGPLCDMQISGTVCMTVDVIAAMSKRNRSFWESFYKLTKKEIEENKKNEKAEPFEPSERLQRLFTLALAYYKGADYCHVQQLKEKFKFAQ